MSLIKSSSKIGVLTLLSRIAGYVRESLIAKYLGAGSVSDAFFVAFRLPNLFRSIFAEGAFNSAFVPMFSKHADTNKAKEFAEKVYSVLLASLLILTIIAQIFMPGLVWLLASGFKADPEKFDLAVTLTRITFPYLIFISLVSLQGGVLNSVHRFSAAAFAPVLMNLTMIAFMLGLHEYTATPAHALSWGVTAAGVVQFVWLAWACKKAGFVFKIRRPHFSPEIKLLLKRMLPVALGAGVLQINVLINTQIASYISDGAVSYLYFADRISQLPLAIIGTAVGTALLPMLSKSFRDNNSVEAHAMQNRGFEFSWFLTIPAALALIAIAEPVVQVLYERGKFDHEATLNVTNALIAYSFGIPAFVLVKIFTPGFYANEDTKTPVQIAVFSILLNCLVSLGLIWGLGFDHTGLAIATSVSQWVNAALLCFVLSKRGLFKFEAKTLSNAFKSLVIAGVMAFTCYLLYNFALERVGLYSALALTVMVGGGIYLGLAFVFKVIDINEIKKLRRKPASVPKNS
jgi:putative peptidoglycan lipid II flippase